MQGLGRLTFLALMAAALCAPCRTSAAQVQNYDFDWVTIGDVGNTAYPGGPTGQLAGRGSVPYAYRISKLEVTSAQWLEFINIFAPQSPNPGSFLRPDYSGIQALPGGSAGQYHLFPNLPNAGMVGVYGISWREAAMYCNWLHNNKSREWSAIMSGAYDVSTFGQNPNGSYTDQLTHSPDARFWIPTLDEWIKAAYYDPNGNGPGAARWWKNPYASDEQPLPGLPGIGMTSAGVTDPVGYANVLDIPLGSYPYASSPWGLLDVSGGTREWTEEPDPLGPAGPYHWARITKGAYAGATGFTLQADLVYHQTYESPISASFTGLRVASTVPAPGGIILTLATTFLMRRRRQSRS